MDQNITPTVKEICDKVGRQAIASAVGSGLTAVSNAAVDNCFPARWFYAVRGLCRDADVECPESLFSFVGIETAKEGAA